MHKLPEILVFAGPNGSGKSTITSYIDVKGQYINADDIKRSNNISDMEAAIIAESNREKCIQNKEDFTFETVLSTERNLELLKNAKKNNYFIRCIYVLTKDPKINVSRVDARFLDGGHSVPHDKIISRYYKCLKLIPNLINLCDIIHIYDNSMEPFRIFKKDKNNNIFIFENELWSEKEIEILYDQQNQNK